MSRKNKSDAFTGIGFFMRLARALEQPDLATLAVGRISAGRRTLTPQGKSVGDSRRCTIFKPMYRTPTIFTAHVKRLLGDFGVRSQTLLYNLR
ncbi:hypothetical protein, partial [Pseudomonas syringae]|uniref:hypothetical protein n=2 Tax=Pseudomonas syringae TaxID=317 RepID=UPI001C124229